MGDPDRVFEVRATPGSSEAWAWGLPYFLFELLVLHFDSAPGFLLSLYRCYVFPLCRKLCGPQSADTCHFSSLR